MQNRVYVIGERASEAIETVLGVDNAKSGMFVIERSERDTYRGNTIENRGCLFIYLLASERSERATLRCSLWKS